MTRRSQTQQDAATLVGALNRKINGWANYFCLGPVSQAYRAVEQHTCRRLRQWLCVKHKERAGGNTRFPQKALHQKFGLVRLTAPLRSQRNAYKQSWLSLNVGFRWYLRIGVPAKGNHTDEERRRLLQFRRPNEIQDQQQCFSGTHISHDLHNHLSSIGYLDSHFDLIPRSRPRACPDRPGTICSPECDPHDAPRNRHRFRRWIHQAR